jgi:hypothetical protein
MTHIAIAESVNGSPVEWLEKVTDEQYQNRYRLLQTRGALRQVIRVVTLSTIPVLCWSLRRYERWIR